MRRAGLPDPAHADRARAAALTSAVDCMWSFTISSAKPRRRSLRVVASTSRLDWISYWSLAPALATYCAPVILADAIAGTASSGSAKSSFIIVSLP